ncbi:MAG: hypothetical protein ACR2O4_09170 [Hyphomicrobiaceae bacterium]
MSGLFAKSLAALAVTALVLSATPLVTPADAGSAISKSRKAKASRATPQVRGSSQGVGGYSYSYEDSIIDFRDRSVFLDPSIDNQSGPFDSGFFFDSGVERQNESPYLN